MTGARLADALAGSLPASAPLAGAASALSAEPSAATRSLLHHRPAEAGGIPMPDSEERRLSHELSFGESDYSMPKPRGGRSLRRLLILVTVISVAIVATILFQPQIVGAVPALASLYAALGL